MEPADIFNLLKQIDCFNNIEECVKPELKKKLACTFSFNDTINEISTQFLIGFDYKFPLSLPQFYIRNYDDYEQIPHIERDGKICYTHDDYVYIDFNNPLEVIRETYELSKTTVENGLLKINSGDFISEFEDYWVRIDNSECIYSNLLYTDEPQKVKIGFHENFTIVTSDDNECINQTSKFFNITDKGISYHNSLLIPFIPSNDFTPPRYNKEISIEYINSIINSLNPTIKRKLEKITPSYSKKTEYVFFCFNQKNGSQCVFGVKFSNIKSGSFPLLAENFEGKITPISVDKLDKNSLYKRGGNSTEPSSSKGLLIGAGSIGGFISEELVRNGFFNLTIVDSDNLSASNSYRHAVGFSKLGKNKAIALKEKIENNFPHSSITAISSSIEELILKKKVNFNNYDFIIVATGNVTINTYLNNEFYSKIHGKPVLYCWNDPYGIGGHCLVTNLQKNSCYNCLYCNDEKYNVASFANSIQPKSFLKNLSGCGSAYTPYGSIDSMQTALLTLKKLIDVLNYNESINGIYSWRGRSEIFLKEGYILSERYKMTDEELNERANSFGNEHCNICKA